MSHHNQKNDWYIWGEWPGIPWFHSCYNSGLALELKKNSGFELKHFACDFKDNVFRLYMLKSEWKKGGQWYLNEILKNPLKLIQDLDNIKNASRKLFNTNKKLANIDPKKCTTKKLASLIDASHKGNHDVWCYGMVTNLLELENSYLSDYLRKYIDKKSKIDVKQKDWQFMINPPWETEIQKEERAFLKLISAHEKNKKFILSLKRCGDNLQKAKQILQRNKKVWRKLKNHHKKYCWIHYGWTGPALDEDYFIDLFVRFIRRGNAWRILKKISHYDKVLLKKQRNFEKKYGIDKKHKILFRCLRQILYLKAYRMDSLYHGYYVIEPYLKEIARRFHISLNQLYMVYLGDLSRILKIQYVDVEKLNSALQYSAYLKEGRHLRFYVKNEAHQKMKSILSVLPKQKPVRMVKGETGYPGKIKGKITYVKTAQENHKIHDGDILMAHDTNPAFLPAMKKAAAFITDIGGLTCHTAIVAREMKKPCIIGTKIATQVFKDGDIVEIDTHKQMVRKIQ